MRTLVALSLLGELGEVDGVFASLGHLCATWSDVGGGDGDSGRWKRTMMVMGGGRGWVREVEGI
jgi:hypothetical protein